MKRDKKDVMRSEEFGKRKTGRNVKWRRIKGIYELLYALGGAVLQEL